MRVLVVEPDEYYHAQYRAIFEPFCELRIVSQGTAALEELIREPPDALIMELLLPDLTGYDLLQEVVPLWHETSFPIIIVSQVDHFEDIKESLNIGIAGYFIKGKHNLQEIKQLVLSFNPVSI